MGDGSKGIFQVQEGHGEWQAMLKAFCTIADNEKNVLHCAVDAD